MATVHAISAALLVLFAAFSSSSNALPLSVRSRWIVEEPTGERVKLACANWEGHMETFLPEGLNKQPMNQIARHISMMGFNCVRITWATYMYTRHFNLTVAQAFRDADLEDALAGIVEHNPQLLPLTVVDAQKALIEELGYHGVMVVLDNQVSQPMWCCADQDGNGFWGDKYFDPKEWLRSEAMVAEQYKNTPNVIAMSLRNELRGPSQNVSVWYENVEKGAKTIHRANPNVLILISGLDYDLTFTFLKERPLRLNMRHKLVYETHRYSFTEGQGTEWRSGPLNEVCDAINAEMENKTSFLFRGKNAAPLFVTEFGIAQLGENPADNNFLACFLIYLAENDLDWVMWALQGSYYRREGIVNLDETYGMFNNSWSALRSPELHSKLQFIQRKIHDPNSKDPHYLIMYHPLSGKCLRVDDNEIHPTDCLGLSRWSQDGEGTPIRLIGTDLCLSAVEDGLPVVLTTDCMTEQSIWRNVANYQIANKDEHGTDLCLHYDPYYSSKLLTRKCIVSNDELKEPENPQTQWFKLIKSNVY